MNSKIIHLAVQGDCEALQTVLNHLDGFMNRLSTRRQITDSGRYVYEPDIYMKDEMQQKLLVAILKFKPVKDKTI